MSVKKPIAVFDIDGTIFRSSLLIELNEKLVAEKLFPVRSANEVERVRSAWLNRQGSYSAYIDTIVRLYERDIKGVRVSDLKRISRKVVAEQSQRVYVYTRDLIHTLRKTHVLAIISFSPVEVVEEFKRIYRFSVASGISYEHRRGIYTGRLAPDTVLDKRIIFERLIADRALSRKGSIGVGDTETDIEFLKLVDRPVAFNPNRNLYAAAKRNHWKIVVERKDVVYEV